MGAAEQAVFHSSLCWLGLNGHEVRQSDRQLADSVSSVHQKLTEKYAETRATWFQKPNMLEASLNLGDTFSEVGCTTLELLTIAMGSAQANGKQSGEAAESFGLKQILFPGRATTRLAHDATGANERRALDW